MAKALAPSGFLPHQGAMSLVMFYHLTRSSAASTLQALLPRALQAGWRVLLRADDHDLQDLDAKLWEGAADSFLPHALAGGGQDADQPILLGNVASDSFDALAIFGTAALDLAEIAPLQRVWVLFDSRDEAQMTRARALWKSVTEAKVHAQYWSEESGKWTKKTQSNAPEPPKADV